MSTTRREFLRAAVAFGAGWAVFPRAVAGDAPPSSSTDEVWLAGDLHSHTVYSRDVLNASNLGRVGSDPGWALSARVGYTPAELIALAATRGLAFLAITDHDTTEGLRDPGYSSSALTLIPGYEHSLPDRRGHAAILGTDERIDGARGARDLLHAARRRGALMIPTHPYSTPYRWSGPSTLATPAMEVWNGGSSERTVRNSIDRWDRERLQRGQRIPAVGGSDHHFRRKLFVNGVGQPTTWVQTASPEPRAILAAIRGGRTTVSALPPGLGGSRLTIRAEDGEELYEVGRSMPVSRPIGVGVEVAGPASSLPHYVRIIVDGRALRPRHVLPGQGQIVWTLRPKRYVRAELLEGEDGRVVAFTSPIWALPAR